MTVPLLLLAMALGVGSLAGASLARASWPAKAPRLAMALWHALGATVVSSVVLFGLALALPSLPLTGGVTSLLARCAMALRAEYASTGSLLLGASGAVLTLAVVARLTWCSLAAARATGRVRRVQRAGLALIGGSPGGRTVVIDDDRPAVYCLPGRRRRDGWIVLSSGAIRRLTNDQVRLVLAHERAHLRQRHHRAVQLTSVLSSSFGFVPLFRHAAVQVRVLTEMAADDAALRTVGGPSSRHARRHSARAPERRNLARALIALATDNAVSPVGALAAAGASALARVSRLSQPEVHLGLTRSGGVAVLVGLALVGPVLIAAAPALCAAAMEFCPLLLAA